MKRCAAAVLTLAVAACEQPPGPVEYQGYVEAELVDIAAPFAGRLAELSVSRGQTIAAGAPLFRLEATSEQAGVDEARARLLAAEARVNNLLSARRTPELQALRAQAAAAAAAADLSRAQLEQAERLFASGFVSKARIDEARATHAQNKARLAEADAQILNASVGIGRAEEVRAAQAEVNAARAQLARDEWQLAQTTAAAPAAGLVYDTYFSPSEWVSAGTPIVSLLPPAHVKLRFFVPEADVATIAVGQQLQAVCSGCPQPIAATVSYVSPRPEYTPPIIYSRQTRAKLVFLVEGRPAPDAGAGLHPGQPIDVRPAGGSRNVPRQ